MYTSEKERERRGEANSFACFKDNRLKAKEHGALISPKKIFAG